MVEVWRRAVELSRVIWDDCGVRERAKTKYGGPVGKVKKA